MPELKRTPKDLDYIGPGKSSKDIEYFMHTALEYILDNNIDNTYVDLNFLYTIKCSHLHYDIKWDKHCIDVMFMQSHGAILDNTLYSLLMKDWEVIHGPKKLNLNKDPEDFFTPHVARKIDHDELHRLIAFYDEPMFKKILKDGKKVLTDRQKWDRISDEEKMICILEEVYVTAFERWPNYPEQMLKSKGIKLYCTSLSKNEYFKYAVTHMKELFNHSSNSYFFNKIREIKNDYNRGN